MILVMEGYRVVTAYHGKEALAGLSKVRPDLIILDFMMPYLTGLEMLVMIRARLEYRNLPVIFTGEVAPTEPQDKYGWNLFLQKPFQFVQLTEAVMQLIGSGK